MGRRASGIRSLALVLAMLTGATAVVGPSTPTARAQDATAAPAAAPSLGRPGESAPPTDATADGLSLALPRQDELAQDAAAVPDGVPPDVIESIDLGKVQAAALTTAAALPEEQWNVASLAWSLAGDAAAAFRFVRDHVRLEPYAGVLRGAEGTLAARAGNAFDRAVLLKALLDAMLLPSRFAFAELDDETAAELLAQSLEPLADPLPPATEAAAQSLDGTRIRVRARRDYAILQGILGNRVERMAGADNAEAVADLRHHVWIQVQNGSQWVDYDTTRPDSEPGQTLATAQSTATEIPAADYQTVTVRLVTEMVEGDRLIESTALERQFQAWDAATSEVFLYFQPEVSGIGGSILQVLGEATYWVPELMVDTNVEQGAQFQVKAGQDIFDPEASPGPLSDSPLAGVRLVVERQEPGRRADAFAHVILDRVPSGARQSGTVTREQLKPLLADKAGPLALVPIYHVMVSSGGSNPRDQALARAQVARFTGEQLLDPESAQGFAFGDLLWPVAVADQTLVTASERMIVPGLDDGTRTHALVADARVYLTSFGPGLNGGGSMNVATDLLADGVRIISGDGAAAGDAARRRIWYGTLQTALETQFVFEIVSGFDPATRQIQGVSAAMSEPLTLLTPDDPGGPPIGVAPALRDAVSSGQLAVVPGDPAASSIWWTIDQTTGATRSIVDPGMGMFGGYGEGRTGTSPPGRAEYLDDQGNRLVRKSPEPVSRCRPGSEYVTLIGCVSTPAAWAIRISVGVGILVVLYAVNKLWQALIS